MKLIMYGVNRDTVSTQDIHKYGLNESTRKCHVNDIRAFDGVAEIVLVTTDSRNEYYLYIDEQTFKHGDLLRYMSCYTGKNLEEIILETYSKFNKDVVEHLYGLASPISEKPESLSVLERALLESLNEQTIGHVLNDLFTRAIRFSMSLYDKRGLYPILDGEVPRAIQTLNDHLPENEDIDYLFIGHNESIKQLVKYVSGDPKAYLTFLERNEKSKKMFASVENWLTLTDNEDWRPHLLSVDMNQLVYRLAKADSVIIGPSVKNAWLSNELLEDMFEMRPTSKKQLILDLSGSQDETLFSNHQSLKYAHINDMSSTNYPAEKIEEAHTLYDEYLTSQTKEFMDNFSLLNEETVKIIPQEKLKQCQVSFLKQIRTKA